MRQPLFQRGPDWPRSKIRNWYNVGSDHKAKVLVGTCFCEGFRGEICIKFAFEESRLPSAFGVRLATQLKV